MMFYFVIAFRQSYQTTEATRSTKVFSIFVIQKGVLRHNERLANEQLLPVLVIVSNAIQVRESKGTHYNFVYAMRF